VPNEELDRVEGGTAVVDYDSLAGLSGRGAVGTTIVGHRK
jgi:hypothetical protein